jgi:3-oxoacid CoA-transferase
LSISEWYTKLIQFIQGVFDVDFTHGLTLIEIADGVTVDEIKAKTEAPFKVSEDLKPML